ncbi:MAG: type II toxin-antitoxin system ParD family antitoxin [Acidobacteria bacterium]|nr:type II toxin-antitoxin system ParD family antitoxin [Acidobacteriota bacterium]MDA1233437.1 type II toxin-antitoxin system ParD family antitoxin [Acidobacteriota bacterium]
MEISLKPEHEKLLQEQLKSGRYQGPSEVVGDALELLHMRQEEIRLVQVGIDQIERGEFRTLNDETDVDTFVEEIEASSKARRAEKSKAL